MKFALVSQVLGQLRERLATQEAPIASGQLVRKGWEYLGAIALSQLYLRNCTRVGTGARVHGKPHIQNLGSIVIGDNFILSSRYVQSHLVTGAQGQIEIGNSVSINYGAGISAQSLVRLGSRVRVGPFAMIMDSDYHGTRNRSESINTSIEIQDNVWLATRVTILRGSRIGANSVITAGSVVSGHIPANVVAGGVPARILRRIEFGEDRTSLSFGFDSSSIPASIVPPALDEKSTNAPRIRAQASTGNARLDNDDLLTSVQSVISETFDLEGPIELTWGPDHISRWTSLGHLQLAIALQEKFRIQLTEEELMQMTTVRAVYEVVRNGCSQ